MKHFISGLKEARNLITRFTNKFPKGCGAPHLRDLLIRPREARPKGERKLSNLVTDLNGRTLRVRSTQLTVHLWRN